MQKNQRFGSGMGRIALALALVGSLLSNVATAAPTANLSDGRTTVALSTEFVTALNTLRVSVGTIGEGALRGGAASFPITGGALDLANAKGEINHTGGLFLQAGTTRVELSSFNIDTLGSAPVLTGLVTANGNLLGRVPLFTLQLPTLTLPLRTQAFDTVFIPGVGVRLTNEAATALNGVFNVTAFTAGLNIGTASVFAVAAPARRRLFLPEFNGRQLDGAEIEEDPSDR
ncbi:MAG: hypothetical protein SF339_00560 [Blastocatellia bacterium]|nr:hypothetical protein [Blastocatellia bacterium]